MKRLYFILTAILISAIIFGQAPLSFKYQAVLRDASGNVRSNADVSIDVAILQGSASGVQLFIETHDVTSNEFGLVNLEIGSKNTTGFSDVDWSLGSYFIKIRVDNVDMGTSQLLSVPYALYAKTAGNSFSGNYNDLSNKPSGNNFGDMMYWDGTGWILVPVGSSDQFLKLKDGVPTWISASEHYCDYSSNWGGTCGEAEDLGMLARNTGIFKTDILPGQNIKVKWYKIRFAADENNIQSPHIIMQSGVQNYLFDVFVGNCNEPWGTWNCFNNTSSIGLTYWYGSSLFAEGCPGGSDVYIRVRPIVATNLCPSFTLIFGNGNY